MYHLNGGEFRATSNVCTHEYAQVSDGFLEGGVVECPLHGGKFDVRTGQSFCDPSKISVRSYPMEVAPGTSVVKGPYVAETIPVTVEEQYVVVEM